MRAHAVKREKREKNELAARYRSKTLARLSPTTSENYESYFVTLSWLSCTRSNDVKFTVIARTLFYHASSLPNTISGDVNEPDRMVIKTSRLTKNNCHVKGIVKLSRCALLEIFITTNEVRIRVERYSSLLFQEYNIFTVGNSLLPCRRILCLF